MDINENTVDYIAKLAMIRMSPEEKSKFLPQLNKILHYMEKLNELDTQGISPTSSVIPMKNVLRDDEVKPSLPQDEVLAMAPSHKGSFFKVPQVI